MSLTVEKCLQAWTNSLKQMNAKADIVFFGDSLTYYGDFSLVFHNKVVCNLGLRGDTIQGMKERMEQVAILMPEKVYLMAGINDVASLTPERFECEYESLLLQLTKYIPDAVIIVQSLLPVNSNYFSISCNNEQIKRGNESIKALAFKYGMQFIDLCNLYIKDGELPVEETVDGIHLKQNCYDKWKASL